MLTYLQTKNVFDDTIVEFQKNHFDTRIWMICTKRREMGNDNKRRHSLDRSYTALSAHAQVYGYAEGSRGNVYHADEAAVSTIIPPRSHSSCLCDQDSKLRIPCA